MGVGGGGGQVQPTCPAQRGPRGVVHAGRSSVAVRCAHACGNGRPGVSDFPAFHKFLFAAFLRFWALRLSYSAGFEDTPPFSDDPVPLRCPSRAAAATGRARVCSGTRDAGVVQQYPDARSGRIPPPLHSLPPAGRPAERIRRAAPAWRPAEPPYPRRPAIGRCSRGRTPSRPRPRPSRRRRPFRTFRATARLGPA